MEICCRILRETAKFSRAGKGTKVLGDDPGVYSTNPQVCATKKSTVLEMLGVGFVWKYIDHLCTS